MNTPWYLKIWYTLRNKSTWTQIGLLLAVLATIAPGVVNPDTPDKYDDLIEYIEDGYAEGQDSVVVAIGKYKELRETVEREVSWATQTGKRIYGLLAGAFALFLSAIGIGKAKRADAIIEAHEIDMTRPFDRIE